MTWLSLLRGQLGYRMGMAAVLAFWIIWDCCFEQHEEYPHWKVSVLLQPGFPVSGPPPLPFFLCISVFLYFLLLSYLFSYTWYLVIYLFKYLSSPKTQINPYTRIVTQKERVIKIN